MAKKPYRLVQQEVDQLEDRIRNHRKKTLLLVSSLVLVVILIAGSLYYNYQTKKYYGYEVLQSVPRSDSAGTKFRAFAGNILKYSNDGVFYIDSANELIWNQTYEMQSPMLDICENYAAIADEKGKVIYIMDAEGSCGEVHTTRSIQQLHVANQGMVAVLMEENGVGYIHLYDKKGSFLAEGELHTKNSGYPLDIAISNDGTKMAVTMLDINDGTVKTTVAFYNFGSVGQNEIDNIVSSYPYEDAIMGKVEFLTNDLAVAVGDTKMVFYEGSQRPVSVGEVAIDNEIRSIFYNDHYVGLVFHNENQEDPYHVKIYGGKGELIQEFDFSMEYEEIEFLESQEICIRNNLECSIYTMRGMQRFHYNFKEDINKIIHMGGRRYIFLMSQTTEKVRLK